MSCTDDPDCKPEPVCLSAPVWAVQSFLHRDTGNLPATCLYSYFQEGFSPSFVMVQDSLVCGKVHQAIEHSCCWSQNENSPVLSQRLCLLSAGVTATPWA